MRKQRRLEAPQERSDRLISEAQAKRSQMEAADAAVDRMIRRNIEQYGA
jgi:hypothetical protein